MSFSMINVKPKQKSKIVLYGHRQFQCLHKNNYKDVVEDVETRFDTSNYELDRPLPQGKNNKVIELMKDELNTKTMI